MTKINYSSTSLASPQDDQTYVSYLSKVRAKPPRIFPLMFGASTHESSEILDRRDPVSGDVVGRAYVATERHIDLAVASAKGAQKAWRNLHYSERCSLLRSVASEFAGRLLEIAALVSSETGKTRLEAVGEIQEVMDMISHYSDQVEKNLGFVTEQRAVAGERNFDLLRPYGVFAVISPFNFPVALAVGMTAGAVLTGNTVVLKPSEKTPGSTSLMAEIFIKHLPAGVMNLINGDGTTGNYLARHDGIDGIAFTGSANVGWGLTTITNSFGVPKPVLAEMGGQNSVIVTKHADLDAAAQGIVRSAFGLSGQKCSALRRVIVESTVADGLTERIRTLASALHVGDPISPETDLGPLIDDDISRKVDETIAEARAAGAEVTGGRAQGLEGNYFLPIVVTQLPIGHPITREEIFAPLLSIVTVESFEAALVEANATEYGLSAGIFSRDESEIATFLDETESGVLYVNRASGATTGAWPGMQSFCGWKRSGTSGKGGLGVWYLPGFMREQNRTISLAS